MCNMILRLHNSRVTWSLIIISVIVAIDVSSIIIQSKRIDFVEQELSTEFIDKTDKADAMWVLISSFLVFIMSPGVALFYSGLVDPASVTSVMLQSSVISGFIFILWSFVGFSLAFGDNWGGCGLIGNPSKYWLLKDVGALPDEKVAQTIPVMIYFVYQAMFAIITPILMIGAVVGRSSLIGMLAFCGVWHLVVYCPLVHMQWHPDGLISQFGHKDYAGGLVVHMSSGYSALQLAYLIGPRSQERMKQQVPPNDFLLIVGTALLWFGWLGFNGGSSTKADFSATLSILNTALSASTSVCIWILFDYIQEKSCRTVGICTSVLVGLVVITPGCGYVFPGSAVLMGIVASTMAHHLLSKADLLSGIDDTLDVWICHGFTGTLGLLLTSFFASNSVYEDNLIGVFYGSATFFAHSIAVLVLVIIYCNVATFIIYRFISCFVDFRAVSSSGGLHGEEILSGTNLDSSSKVCCKSLTQKVQLQQVL